MKKNKKYINNKIDKLLKNYDKIYLDVLKHSHDIEKWINSGNRKKGDLKRSLIRLENKYDQLCETEKNLKKEYLMESDILNNIPAGRKKYNLIQIDNKINNLYEDAGIINNRQHNNRDNRYHKTIDIINDVPGFDKRDTNLIIENQVDIENNKKNEQITNMPKKVGRIKKVWQKIKDNVFDIHKTTSKVAAISLAGIIAIFGGSAIGESNWNTKTDEIKSYTDANNEKNDFKDSIYFNASDGQKNKKIVEKETETTTEIPSEAESEKIEVYTINETEKSQNKKEKNNNLKSNKKEISNKKILSEGKSSYLVKENTKYTAVSDGSGPVGYFDKDSKVKVYNMALVQKEKNGTKRILIYTKPGESWSECAKRKGINIKEIRKYVANKDVEICYSLKSEDGKKLYGWTNKDKIENIQKNSKNIDKERN